MEIVLLRFADDFHSSQPSHLLRYAIVKDVAQVGKNTHFHFYTYDNFSRLVASGQATWSDSAPVAGKDGPAKAQDRGVSEKSLPGAGVDEYGFPLLRNEDFHGEGGTESLPDMVRTAGVVPFLFNRHDVIVARGPDGRPGRFWRSSS